MGNIYYVGFCKMLTLEKFFTIPNVVSIFRIYLTVPIVLFLWMEWYVFCLVLVIIGYISDAVDGILARSLNQVSEWGKVLDPLGDKILSTALVVSFAYMGMVSVMFCVLVVLRDLLISIVSSKIARNYSLIKQSAFVGKLVTFMLGIFYSVIILNLIMPLGKEVIMISEIVILFFVVLSGVYYLVGYLNKESLKNEGR